MVRRWKRELARGKETSGILFLTMQSQSDNLCRAEKNNEAGGKGKESEGLQLQLTQRKNESDGEWRRIE